MQSSFVGGTVVWTYVKHLIEDLFSFWWKQDDN